ncbi:Transcriptional regulator, RpiR family [Devosia sp. LC5]|uniref:MurR/RpiR family transcriptional regulator n=1 Tax=Devosia sp. LC5 TaxID=1502724 RepID=UPI0004E3C6B6|nr:MurR/RpiR family transcriptional regulator [Devosia sp. LC5]KFC61260.1 Transcriptional regulator, RpiR family [Devosia sp. LC5]
MEGKSVAARIHDAIHRLTPAEKRAARGLLGAYPTLGLAPVAEFGQQAGASSATVLRFVSQLGYKSYPDFQRALRDELEERAKSPLQRGQSASASASDDNFLDRFVSQAAGNLRGTAGLIPPSEFEAVCQRIAEAKGQCYLGGGRFTDFLAGYMEAHLRLIRPGMRRFDGRPATRADQMIDVRPGDTAILFDVRRYDPSLLEAAGELAARRAQIILITDEWMSPVSRYAKLVLPCRTALDRTWDANGSLFTLVEAIIARVTELAWPIASKRIGSIEPGGVP